MEHRGVQPLSESLGLPDVFPHLPVSAADKVARLQSRRLLCAAVHAGRCSVTQQCTTLLYPAV